MKFQSDLLTLAVSQMQIIFKIIRKSGQSSMLNQTMYNNCSYDHEANKIQR